MARILLTNHHRFPLRLSNLVLGQVKRLTDMDPTHGLLIAKSLGSIPAHPKRSGLNTYEFHANAIIEYHLRFLKLPKNIETHRDDANNDSEPHPSARRLLPGRFRFGNLRCIDRVIRLLLFDMRFLNRRYRLLHLCGRSDEPRHLLRNFSKLRVRRVPIPAHQLRSLIHAKPKRQLDVINLSGDQNASRPPSRGLIRHPIRVDRRLRPNHQHTSRLPQRRCNDLIISPAGGNFLVPPHLPSLSFQCLNQWPHALQFFSGIAEKNIRHSSRFLL